MKIHWIDLSIIVLYLVSILFFSFKFKVDKNSKGSSDEYFLAGKTLGWFLIGASLFASNIGSEHLIGLAGAGASSGVAVAQFEILACLILLLLGWFFVPYYLGTEVTTMPEFLEKRYSSQARSYLAVVSVIAYVLTKISVTIYAGAVVFETVGVPFWIGAFSIVAITGVYTVVGGLKAVIYTDMIQMFIMIFGSLLVTTFGLYELGGVGEFMNSLPPEFLNMWKPSTDANYPWTGILFGAPILGIWYWCTDQFVVQRVLSARNIEQARRGSIFGGFLKILPLFIFVFPGMIAYALNARGLIQLSTPDTALPALVNSILPIGLRGFVFSGLLAALMSSLSSVFNSCSTLITYDFYLKRFPNTPEGKLVKVGQISSIILVFFGFLWIPLMKMVSGELFQYIQSIQAYISPPIAAVFLLGIFFERLNSTGALASLYIGGALGVSRLLLEINKDSLSGILLDFAQMNFLHFAILLFLISSLVLIVVSLLSKEKAKPIIKNGGGETKASTIDYVLSALLIVLVLIIWAIFS